MECCYITHSKKSYGYSFPRKETFRISLSVPGIAVNACPAPGTSCPASQIQQSSLYARTPILLVVLVVAAK